MKTEAKRGGRGGGGGGIRESRYWFGWVLEWQAIILKREKKQIA
jgi:hypothetical protein